MFANAIQSLASTNVPLNWFDGLVVLVLGFGLFRGRKNGMSKEILPLSQWLAVVLVSGFLYAMVAQILTTMVTVDTLTGYLLGYAILALALFGIFSVVKRPLAARLFSSNLFGGAEYYLGMLSGLIRFSCILLFALAFLNARHYTPAQIEAGNNYQNRWYGAHFFPDLYTVQDQVFRKSFTGPYIKEYLGMLLIEPTTMSGSGNQTAQDEPAD